VTRTSLVFTGRLALEAVARNPLRAGLTSLGILFGVASVIAMLAIGRGAEQEILAQMRLLGSNNVIVTALVEPATHGNAASDSLAATPARSSPGLTVHDEESFLATVPDVDAASGEVVHTTTLFRESRRATGKLIGIDGDYFELMNLSLVGGRSFLPTDLADRRPVAIIGERARTRLFLGETPLGKQIRVGHVWLTVVGIVGQRSVSLQASAKLGVRDPSLDIYIPVSTMLLLVHNRSRPKPSAVSSALNPGACVAVGAAAATADSLATVHNTETADERRERLNYHQLDRVIVRARSAEAVPLVAELVQRQLARRHNGVVDFEVTVPELLLRQEQRSKNIFNIVLGAIASISLVVGGIGIMNIMLASVLERIREIGVRRAVGARRRDVLAQFLTEAVLISLAGGVAGIVLGVGTSLGIEHFARIQTSVSPWAVVLAFGVSITIGLAFGIMPAWRAAAQDPVTSLRYE